MFAFSLCVPSDIAGNQPQMQLEFGQAQLIARTRLNIIALLVLKFALQMPYADLTKYVPSGL